MRDNREAQTMTSNHDRKNFTDHVTRFEIDLQDA